jgi:UPF0755 protein
MGKREKILISLASLALMTIIFSVSYFDYYLNKPASKEKKEIEFVIKKGEGVREIAMELEGKELLKDDLPFLIYLKLSGHIADIKAGTYRLSSDNTPLEIVDILTKGKVASRKITIPEGWNNQEIAEYLEKQGMVKKAEFLAAAKENYDYAFLKDLPEDASVEGFLFPDTYQIPYHADSKYIINRMLENFDSKLTAETRAEIGASKYNVFHVVTLASIVEKEASKPQDRKTVAGIFLARLDEGQLLQSDVTLQYIYGLEKKSFSNDETTVDSPYNTYKYDGLPIGPITNPGMDAINAVLHPEMTDFRYFLAADGVVYYSKTLDEHETKKLKYLK